jgi:hypothetical protein
LSITIRHFTISRTHLDELSARRRGFLLIIHNIHKGQTSKLLAISNPQSQQASGHRPTLLIAWPLWPAEKYLFSLLRIKGLYTFRVLLAHPQEALHKRDLVHRVRVMSVDCARRMSK